MKPLSASERRTIKRRYLDDMWSTPMVAREIGRCQAVVHAYLVRMGWNRSRSEARLASINRERPYTERLEAGLRLVPRLGFVRAARAVGVHKSSLRRHASEAGVESCFSTGRPPLRTQLRRDLVMQVGRLRLGDGLTYAQIAERTGLCLGSVYYYLRDYHALVGASAAFQRGNRLEHRRSRIRTMLAGGMSLAEIAAELGVSTSTVSRDRMALQHLDAEADLNAQLAHDDA